MQQSYLINIMKIDTLMPGCECVSKLIFETIVLKTFLKFFPCCAKALSMHSQDQKQNFLTETNYWIKFSKEVVVSNASLAKRWKIIWEKITCFKPPTQLTTDIKDTGL